MKKVIAVLCICGLMGLTAGLPLSRAAAEEKTETQNGNISASDQVTYPEYCRNTGSVPSNPGEKLSLYAADCAEIAGDNISLENSAEQESGKIIRWVSSEKDSSVLWRFNVSKGARYRLKIRYCALESNSSISLGLKINGEYPFTACGQTVVLYDGELAAALSLLPEQAQEEVFQYYFQHRTHKQISAEYGQTRSTAGRHIQLALQQLRREMEKHSRER